MTTEQKFDDDTILTFGKYKFTKLCRVPPDYLLKFLENKTHPFYDYVSANLEKIIMRKEGILPIPNFEFPCTKISYPNENSAKAILRKVRDMEQSHKKPIRAYECDICGAYHLTSKEKHPI